MSLEVIDMLFQSPVLVLQGFSFVLQVQNDILLVRVELVVSSFSPASEGLLDFSVIHSNNKLLIVKLFPNFTSIKFILPSKEVASNLSIDHSADDVFGP